MTAPATKPVSLLLAVVSALLYALAFPPHDHGGVAFVALVPLLLVVRGQRGAMAAVLGFVTGALAGVTVSSGSILEATTRFLPEARWSARLLAVGLPVVYGGPYFAAFALAAQRLGRRGGGPLPALFLVPAAWVACELGRARIAGGAPWALLGHSQHDWHALIQIADLGGGFLVSYLVLLGNVAVTILVDRRAPRPPARARLAVVAAAAGVAGAALLYGARQMERFAPPRELPLRVALVQGNVPDDWRYSLRHLADTMTRMRTLTASAAAHAPDLVVWPENAVSVSVADNQRVFAGIAGTLGPETRLLIGAPRVAAAGDAGPQLRNSAFLLDAGGRVLGIYDKLHLTPFGEFHPWGTRGLLGSSALADDDYSSGTQWTLFDVAGHRFATVICYEAIYAELVRHFVRAGAEFIVNISNDGWFGGQPSLLQHLHATLFRAVENRRWLLRATNAGITAVVDPRGVIVAEAPRAETTTLVAAIAPSAVRSVYTRVGDLFAWLCVVVTAVAMLRSPPGKVFDNVEPATSC